MLRACVAAVVIAAAAAPAHGYEFWLRAQTIAQGYQLRSYRLVGPDLLLDRRRYSQTLALRIWDIGDLAAARREARLPDTGLTISWQSYLRVDHDFGDYTGGRITLPVAGLVRRDALDVIPELAESTAALQLLYGYAELAGLVDGRLTVRLGRMLADDGWGTTAIDGGSLRVALAAAPLAVTASAGLRVRAASPLGLAAYELDGTSGAACREYVEGPSPGTGSWRLIDRSRMITNQPLASDYEYCPQREVWQPTVAVTLATARLRGLGAALGYRRTWSSTVGLIGAVDRLNTPDLGLYPDERGQAPASGVDEELLWGRIHGELAAAGLVIAPYADLRYSRLHAVVDRADAGVAISRGDHTVEPAIEYFYPSFDGDSIFNAFAIEPTTDLRLGYRRAGALAIAASGWLRRYHSDEPATPWAGGVAAGVSRRFGAWRAQLDALWDDGYGGRRAGVSGEAAWRPAPPVWLRGRTAILAVARDDRGEAASAHPRYATSAATVATTWRVSDGVAVHATAQVDYDALHDLQYRALAMLDFAFAPEP